MNKNINYQLEKYYRNNAKNLHDLVDRIVKKFGGISQKDKDDIYSIANIVFAKIIKSYDGERDFDAYLYSCLSNKIKEEITRRNRYKRKADRMSISIYTPVLDNDEVYLSDILPSKFSIEDELSKEYGYDEDKIEKYMSKLSNKQKKIVEMLLLGYKPFEIKKILSITEKEYLDHMMGIRSYENICILF